MTDIKKNERFIPIKNYFKAILIVVVAICLVWYVLSWYRVLKENKVATSYLVKEKIVSKEINDLSEVNDVFLEAPTNYFVYVSFTGDEDIYNMEKELKSLIIDYNLNDLFYYLNISSIKDDKELISKVNEALNLNGIKITNIPTIIYFKDREAIDVIKRSDDNIMNAGDFQKLLDENNISK